MSVAIDELLELSVPDKLDVLERLWDSITADPKQVAMPEWHLEELDRREEELQRNPQTGTDWNVVKQRLQDRHA
ncbi:MAG: addiction module protein [Planctomycetaceae bacterium]|nr:addiction module protein [Planctomycetaceae bacterium]